MVIQRRTFLKSTGLASASFMVPKLLKAFEKGPLAGVNAGNKVIVVLQMSGGNDGLNTVIPIRNDIYYKSRPVLGIAREKALGLTDETGIHPALTSFADLYNDGSMAILNSVGYPEPDRSHFRSMDIWQTGSKSSETWSTGWLGRYLDGQCKDCGKPTQAVEMDDVLSLAMKGEREKGLAFKDPRRLYNSSHAKYFTDLATAHDASVGKTLLNPLAHADAHERPVDYLYKTMSETVSSADYIFEHSKGHPSTAAYPATELGSSLKTIASLIFSDINTKAYYVSLGSFDTHINQQQQQERLFKEMNDGVAAFIKDLKANNRFDDVLLFTFSEFGRRVSQNASNGTDHGTANNMFLFSGALKRKGVLNPMPDLANLKDGDLVYQVDFKNVYATVLNKWLQADDAAILGRKYDHMDFI